MVYALKYRLTDNDGNDLLTIMIIIINIIIRKIILLIMQEGQMNSGALPIVSIKLLYINLLT